MTNKIRTIILIAALGILNATGPMHVEHCAALTDGTRSTFTYSEEGRGLLVNFQKYFYRYGSDFAPGSFRNKTTYTTDRYVILQGQKVVWRQEVLSFD